VPSPAPRDEEGAAHPTIIGLWVAPRVREHAGSFPTVPGRTCRGRARGSQRTESQRFATGSSFEVRSRRSARGARSTRVESPVERHSPTDARRPAMWRREILDGLRGGPAVRRRRALEEGSCRCRSY
jgi:hypothetical protein